jgi:hypothetical protein
MERRARQGVAVTGVGVLCLLGMICLIAIAVDEIVGWFHDDDYDEYESGDE